MTDLSAKNSMLIVVHPHSNECCAVTGKGTPETEAAVDTIARVVPHFREAGVPVRFIFAAKAGEDPHKAFGGIHPKVAALIGPDDVTYQEYDPSVYAAQGLRDEIKSDVPRHHILAGFNLSDCLGKSAIQGRVDKELGILGVTIMSDAAADREDIAMAELYADAGIGESMMHAMMRTLKVEKIRSHIIMGRLGISAP